MTPTIFKLGLNSYLFSFCFNDGPQIRSMRLSLLLYLLYFSLPRNVRFYSARAVMENFWRARRLGFGWPSVCSGALHLLLFAAASTTAALLLLPAVTLHRPARAVTKLDGALPHGLLHCRKSRSSTPACHQSSRPSHSASRRRLPHRGIPCTQLLPARLSQRQPVGVHAAGQTTN